MAKPDERQGAWGAAPATATSLSLYDFRFRGCAALSTALLLPALILGMPLALQAGLAKGTALMVAAALVVPVILFIIAARVRGSVVIGTDGVLISLGWRSRFVHLDEIEAVTKRAPHPEAQLTTNAHWRVELELSSGETVAIPTALRRAARDRQVSRMLSLEADDPKDEDERPADPVGDGLVRAIERARRAHRVRQRGLANHEAPALERGTRDGAEWLAELRGLAVGKGGGYRQAGLDLEQLPRLVDHAGVTSEARIAAAVVLTESGDEQARPRLRILADSVAEPRLRKALVRIADADTDEDLAAALDRVPSEGRRGQRS